MFGFRFIKAQPNAYLLQYSRGRLVREGEGLAFYYFAPTTSLVAVPMGSADVPFIINGITSDFQEAAIQGQITYRVVDPKLLAGMLNFTLGANGRDYVSDDPQKLPQRLINVIQVLMRSELQGLTLRNALGSTDGLSNAVRDGLSSSQVAVSLGLELLDLSIVAVRSNPEMARALEAEMREQLLREADEATYARRNAAVEQERTIKENELSTEIAVENKKRQIREAQMDAERAVQERRHQMQQADIAARISLEEKNKTLVALSTENAKQEADAKAYATSAVLNAFSGVDSRTIQALAGIGMDPSQLIAIAFRDIAQHTDKIGQLNISPELLQELMQARAK
jgi:regulator of protease activity HflC (stomatin/prohibitin superfamily)